MRLAFQAATGRHAVQVAVEVELEQRGRMIAGAAGVGGRGTVEAQLSEVQLVHEGVGHAHRVVLAHVVVHAFGQQEALASVPALDVARHDIPLLDWIRLPRRLEAGNRCRKRKRTE